VGVPALVSIFVTLLGGTMVAADWYDAERVAADSRAAALVAGHVLLAATVLVLGVIFVLGKSAAVAWATVGVLLFVVALGVTAYLRSTRSTTSDGSGGQQEGVLPGLLIFHGAAAAITILLVVSTALATR
jgi:hypothetical protein